MSPWKLCIIMYGFLAYVTNTQSSGWMGSSSLLNVTTFIPPSNEYTIDTICGYTGEVIDSIGNITWKNGLNTYINTNYHGGNGGGIRCFQASCINQIYIEYSQYNNIDNTTRKLEMTSKDNGTKKWGLVPGAYKFNFSCNPGNCVSALSVNMDKLYVTAINVECQKQITLSPTIAPSLSPSLSPTLNPTTFPTLESLNPSNIPSITPTTNPTIEPTLSPSVSPTFIPSLLPSISPTKEPSIFPTLNPSQNPTIEPTQIPTIFPTNISSTYITQTSHNSTNQTNILDSGKTRNKNLTIILIIAFGCFGVILLVLLLLFIYLYIKKRNQQHEINTEMMSVSSATSVNTVTIKTPTSQENINADINAKNEGTADHVTIGEAPESPTETKNIESKPVTNNFNTNNENTDNDDDDDELYEPVDTLGNDYNTMGE